MSNDDLTPQHWGADPAATITPAGAEGWGAIPPVAEVPADLPKFEVKYPGQPETEEPEAFRLRRNAEIQRWLDAKETLGNSKQHESDWRSKVSSTLFPTPKKGTQRYDVGGGYSVKLIYNLSYTLGDKDKIDPSSGAKVPVREQIEELEAKVAEMGEAHRIAFENVVSWKPEVSGSAYEKLNMNDEIQKAVKLAIDEHLTIKPGSPQLTWEEPKEQN